MFVYHEHLLVLSYPLYVYKYAFSSMHLPMLSWLALECSRCNDRTRQKKGTGLNLRARQRDIRKGANEGEENRASTRIRFVQQLLPSLCVLRLHSLFVGCGAAGSTSTSNVTATITVGWKRGEVGGSNEKSLLGRAHRRTKPCGRVQGRICIPYA